MRTYDHIMGAQPATSAAQLGAVIRGARKDAGLTQAQLAERARVSRRWLLRLENGRAPGAELSKILTTLNALNLRLTVDTAPPRASLEQELERLLDLDDH